MPNHHPQRLATFEEKRQMLNKISWGSREIALYFGYCENIATKCKKDVISKYGEAKYNVGRVYVEDVLKEHKTDRITEIKLMNEGLIYGNEITKSEVV